MIWFEIIQQKPIKLKFFLIKIPEGQIQIGLLSFTRQFVFK